ncbi:MAG: ATP-binding protein [Alphaproteobacteria bacterium]
MVSQASPSPPPRMVRFFRWAGRVGLSRKLAVLLAIGALISGTATYGALSGWGPFGNPAPRTILVLLNLDLVLVLLLSAVVLRNLVQLWLERRRGIAGSRLHLRLAAMFSIVAVAPAITVAVFSVLFLNLGIESWFNDRVRTAVEESVAVAEAYLEEHRQIIRADALAMANDINRAGPTLLDYPYAFDRFLTTQAALRSLTEATVFRRDGRVLGRTGLTFSLFFERIPVEAMQKADATGDVVILTADTDDRVRALVRLEAFVDAYLFVGRFVDSRAIGHMERTQRAASEYERLEGRRSGIQITFALIFGVVTLLLLLAAIWLGLRFANRLVGPIGNLITAAEHVRAGNLKTRVDEGPEDDEISSLSRAFNRMTDQIEAQRDELIEANRQLDARRRFTESVLSGVSAGVIGLDSKGCIELPNRSALELLASSADALIGRRLSDAVPEMDALLVTALARPTRGAQSQINVTRKGRTRTLLVRIGAERFGESLAGFVVTFDDITALLVAQRTAAWADVARRIAHEIKNPLTPIQLSAERIKRKYLKEIRTDPETFTTCTDTIVRQVGDIGRMIDEFSAFARMPAPVFKAENVIELVRQAIVLQEVAHPEIAFVLDAPEAPVMVRCDGHQVGQVLTNVLKNAAESIDGRSPPAKGALEPGRVGVTIELGDDRVVVEMRDNGRGLPAEPRHRLVEPYVTTRTKGTGLGLAIVKKIMEDHGGELVLDDHPDGGACVRLIFVVDEPASAAPSSSDRRKAVSHGS